MSKYTHYLSSHLLVQTVLQAHVTWDRCGGPEAAACGFFHILVTDHGCKLTQVKNSSKSSVWQLQDSFPGKWQAGVWVERFLYCFSAKLTEVIVLTVKEGETVFKQSNWGEIRAAKTPCLHSSLPSAVAPTQRHKQREKVPTLKQAAHFPFPHLFLMLMAGYNL